MLFDLRGRHRRRAVRIIYTGLAILMGVGLVGFGVGGGFGGGGLLSAASNNEGSNGASFSSQIKKYEKLTKEQPSNAVAWEKLADAQLHEAGSETYVLSSGVVTSKGKELYSQVAHSWNSYIALNPAKPNPELAQRMAAIFEEEGLNEPTAEVQVLQIVVAARPTSASLYAKLAEYAYRAHNPRVGDLAAEKAITLAPVAQRPRLRTELNALKKNPTGSQTATPSPTSTATSTGTSSTTTPTSTGTSSTKTK